MKKNLLIFTIVMLICTAFIPGKNKIAGIVLDNNSQPLASVSVVIKGTKNGTSTNNSGAFSLEITKDTATIVVSLVGYKTQEIKAVKNVALKVILQQETKALDEVVVTGYATQKKSSMMGSVSSVSVSAYQSNSPSVVNALQGRVAGLSVSDKSRYSKNKRVNAEASKYSDTDEKFNTEDYDYISENTFLKVKNQPLSTFSIDVDAASYSNIRRFINAGQLPPADAVRIEEMINYFTYNYPQPDDEHPFNVVAELAQCPWNEKHQLALIALQGKNISYTDLPASNLVFLIDVSGSMSSENKLPLVKSSLKLLVDQLRPQDHVSLVVYAGNAGLVLPSTSGDKKTTIKNAIDKLESGGSTAGGAGIELAYNVAAQNFVKEGNNRVILCTDGDFNVGQSSDGELERLIEKRRESGVFLTVLGYGMGNYKDSKMQKLADKGNGNHAYIDGITEAKKVLVNEFGGTLFTIAKDVKLQIEFNPAKVKGYRLIGYENRMLAKEDFNNDKKDAGELGSGHTVTALYEIIPTGVSAGIHSVDDLRYQKEEMRLSRKAKTKEMMNVKLRYKQPDGNTSELMQIPVAGNIHSFNNASGNLRFAAGVAAFGMLLRDSRYKGKMAFNDVEKIATASLGEDKEGYRREFVTLVQKASEIKNSTASK